MPAEDNERLTVTHLIYPQWSILLLVVGGVTVVVLGVLAWLVLGVSATSDRVFAIEALLSGLSADQIFFRRFLRRRLVVAPKVAIPFLYLWPLVCLYVFLAQPFMDK
jgi:hypothetical protein